jgi:hypothetical protein
MLAMLKCGNLIFMLYNMCYYRNLFLEFGANVFKIPVEYLQATSAYRRYQQLRSADAKKLFQAQVLAYAPATWYLHSNSIQAFMKFCEVRGINPLECTPLSLNIFLLTLAQAGKSLAVIESNCNAITFCLKFFGLRDIVKTLPVEPVKSFIAKVCPRNTNLKAPFASAEVRKLWNLIECKYKNLSAVPITELRTFVLAITQYSSFCRFSDLAVVKLSDICFDIDYFKIVIQYSKTDQAGSGQNAFILRSVDCVRDPHMLMCLYLQRLDSYDVQDLYLFPPVV